MKKNKSFENLYVFLERKNITEEMLKKKLEKFPDRKELVANFRKRLDGLSSYEQFNILKKSLAYQLKRFSENRYPFAKEQAEIRQLQRLNYRKIFEELRRVKTFDETEKHFSNVFFKEGEERCLEYLSENKMDINVSKHGGYFNSLKELCYELNTNESFYNTEENKKYFSFLIRNGADVNYTPFVNYIRNISILTPLNYLIDLKDLSYFFELVKAGGCRYQNKHIKHKNIMHSKLKKLDELYFEELGFHLYHKVEHNNFVMRECEIEKSFELCKKAFLQSRLRKLYRLWIRKMKVAIRVVRLFLKKNYIQRGKKRRSRERLRRIKKEEFLAFKKRNKEKLLRKKNEKKLESKELKKALVKVVKSNICREQYRQGLKRESYFSDKLEIMIETMFKSLSTIKKHEENYYRFELERIRKARKANV